MYIKSIKLQNYRNYENLDIELGKKATVLIGKNGMGKTNLISALKQSLSFAFSKNSNISQKNFVANTIASIKSFEPTDATRKMKEDGTQSKDGSYPVKITTTMDIDSQNPLEVVLEKTDVNSGIKELYVNASIAFWKKYDDLKDLPVYGFYSDSYPHERVTIGTKIQKLLNSEFGISQTAGYYNWDDPRDCTLVWLQFFTQQWKNYMYGHRDNDEEEYLKSVRECLKEFSEPLENAAENTDFELKDITVVARGKNEVVVLQFKNGLELDFDSLPAGYRRAYSIAFDLANRAFLLNKNCNPDGVAFIDEVDLHLHPSLAQEIVERLQHTFPRIQFIVSTHSPLVLSNFKQDEDNVVYQLNRKEDFTTSLSRIPNAYGSDYNSLLTSEMETPVRNSLLQELREAYLYWERANDENRMKKVLDKIISRVGEDSVMVRNLKGTR